MKTNNERAKIILDRVYEAKQVPEPKEAALAKKKLGWRMITAICVAAVVFIGAISGLILGLTLPNGKGGFDLDNMFIANFSSYTAIGVGEENKTTTGNVAFAYDDDDGQKPGRLVGVKDDGKVEELKYCHDRDDEEEHEIEPIVVAFHAFNNYSIVSYHVDNSFGEFSENYFYAHHDDYKGYIIDNRTGKFYSIDVLNTKDYSVSNRYFFGYRPHYSTMAGINGNWINDITYDGLESDSSIYFYQVGYDNNSEIVNKIYRARVVGEKLELKAVYSQENDKLLIVDFFVDKYDNIFMEARNGTYYIKNSQGGIKSAESETPYFKSINGIAYHFTDLSMYSGYGDNLTPETADKMIDKDGNVVDTDFNCGNVSIDSQYKIKSVGNVDYYYFTENVNKFGSYYYKDNSDNKKESFEKIRKITWLDDERTNFKYEEILLDLKTIVAPQYVATENYLYLRLSEQILKVEITTGVTTTLASDYIFTEIETDNLGNVKFEGLRKEDGSNVTGIINSAGEIDVNFKKPEYEVYYIKPLGR